MCNEKILIIPEYDPVTPGRYPGDIKPGKYSETQVKALLKKHKSNPEALQFIRDMLE